MKSFKPRAETDGAEPPAGKSGSGESGAKIAGEGRNAEADFHGEKRSNETHASVTDPDARLYRKGDGKEASLCYLGHALVENRKGVVVEACLTRADGHGEWHAALVMIKPRADRPLRTTLGATRDTTQKTSSMN